MTKQEYEKERLQFEDAFKKVYRSTPDLERKLEHFRMPNDFFPVRYFKPKTHTAYQWWLIGREEQRREYYLNQSAWISVADRLPENGQRVLVVTSLGGVMIEIMKDTFVNKHSMWSAGKTHEYYYTHWQPIPQPPKAK